MSPARKGIISLDTTPYRDVPTGTSLESSSELGEIKDAFLLWAPGRKNLPLGISFVWETYVL